MKLGFNGKMAAVVAALAVLGFSVPGYSQGSATSKGSSTGSSMGTSQQGSSSTQTGTSASATAPTDAEIAHIVETSNKIDIEAGKMAESKSSNKEVKDFAKQMVKDHQSVNKQTKDLAKKLGVKPKENTTSMDLEANAKKTMADLKTLKGKEFDKAYVDHEVSFHQSVLNEIDNTLAPNAKNEDLKSLIEKVRPSIEAHLQHAKSLQAKM